MGTVEGEMPMLLLLAVALLAGPQDDPSVLYREGLYEEIDQGNLEKALDLYGRLLKGSADAALKARAFYRRGACLEKMGKKADAEQVYRDVQERFPEQSEILKLARGRLAAATTAGPSGAVSLEAEIQQLILDLGNFQVGDPTKLVREKAIHRLTLIGETALPELKRALAHKDKILACGAARVLLELEHPEGTYEVLLRSLLDQFDQRSFGKLISQNEDARKRFYRESDQIDPSALQLVLQSATVPLKDPGLRKSVEDRLLKAELRTWIHSYLIHAWWTISGPEQLPGLVRRLFRESEKPQFAKIQSLLGSRPGREKIEVPRELAADLLEVSKSQDIPEFAAWIRVVLPYVPPKDLIQVVLPSWLKGPDAARAYDAAQMMVDKDTASSLPGMADFIGDALVSKEYHDDVKMVLSSGLRSWAGEELNQDPLKPKLLQYYLDYLRRFPPKPLGKSSAPDTPARDYLIRLLPDEADGWELLCDLDMTQSTANAGIWSTLDRRIVASERLRSLYVQAATRALQHELPEVRQRGERQLNRYISSRELRELATILPKLAKHLIPPLTAAMITGYQSLSVEERKTAMKELAPLFKSPNVQLRQYIVFYSKSFTDGSVDAYMKDALDDPETPIRQSALEFWVSRSSPEAVPVLIKTLQDPDDKIKIMAIGALGRSPSLDSVPALLDFLRSSNSELRSAAQVALKAIQQYYDEQDQWRKWYEDTRKKVPKDR
jgi:HEAT repeat protein